MAAPEKLRVTDTEQLERLRQNLTAMQGRLAGRHLHVYRRNLSDKPEFAAQEEKEHRPAFHAAQRLPAQSTLQGYYAGREAPTWEDVDRIAEFCTAAFSFDKDTTIIAHDLLTREIEFPALRPTQSWERYKGTYRCFYFYPDLRLEESGGVPKLQGGLLRLWERDGELNASLITGIRRDEQFLDLERLISKVGERDIYPDFKAYNNKLPEHESRLVSYQDRVDTTLPGYLTMRLRRQGSVEHGNVAYLILRRFDKSAQPKYSGGIASVTLCRGGNLTSFAMVVVREKLTMTLDGDFNARYLAEQGNDGRGLRITEESEGHWNRAMLERVGQRKAGKA